MKTKEQIFKTKVLEQVKQINQQWPLHQKAKKLFDYLFSICIQLIMYESNTNTNTENKKAFQKWLITNAPKMLTWIIKNNFETNRKSLKLLFLLSKNNARIFYITRIKRTTK